MKTLQTDEKIVSISNILNYIEFILRPEGKISEYYEVILKLRKYEISSELNRDELSAVFDTEESSNAFFQWFRNWQKDYLKSTGSLLIEWLN